MAEDTADSMSERDSPRFSGPKAMSSSTDSATIWSPGDWKTMPTGTRKGSFAGDRLTEPESGESKPATSRVITSYSIHYTKLYEVNPGDEVVARGQTLLEEGSYLNVVSRLEPLSGSEKN